MPGESNGQRMMPLLTSSLVLLIGVVSRRHRFCVTQWLALAAGALGEAIAAAQVLGKAPVRSGVVMPGSVGRAAPAQAAW